MNILQEETTTYKSKSVGFHGYFYVEKLLDKLVVDGAKHYRVKWFHFCKYDNSWEPEEYLSEFCQVLMDEFDQQEAEESEKQAKSEISRLKSSKFSYK